MLNFRRAGRGRTLVLMHGFVGGSAYWTTLMGEFGRWRDVVAVDLPGFAGSGDRPVPNSIAGFGEAVFERLDSLSIESFDLVGHSMGGMIAQEMAFSRPDRIERLVLYGSAPIGELPGRFETYDDTIARIQNEGLTKTIDRIASSWFLAETADPAYPSCRSAGEGVTMEACITAIGAIRQWDMRDQLASLTMPILVVVGEHDRSTAPSESVALWQTLPNARLCILPDCAHAAHLEKPQLFDNVLADFLRERD